MQQTAAGGVEGDDPAADAMRTLLLLHRLSRNANKCLTPVYYAAISVSTRHRTRGADGPNMSMLIQTCFQAPKSTNCLTICRCGRRIVRTANLMHPRIQSTTRAGGFLNGATQS